MSDIAERVKKIVVEHLGVEADKVTENASFIDDLGADSLDTVELVMAFEEEFGCRDPRRRRRDDPDRRRRGQVHREERGLTRCAAPGDWPARSGVYRRSGQEVRMRRVVVTGLGMVTPLGCGVEPTLDAPARRPERRARRSSASRSPTSPARSPARSRAATAADGTFNPDQWMEPKEQRKVDDFIVYAHGGGDAGARGCRLEARRPTRTQMRTGVLIGSGIGGLGGIAETAITAERDAARAGSRPFFIPGRLINLASRLGLDRARPQGPEPRRRHRLLDRRARDRRRGAADRARRRRRDGGRRRRSRRSAGSAIAGFAACRALSTGFNDDPTSASRPYDKDRDGFVMGEGAGVVVLEEYEHAKARGAKIYAEVIGYGLSGDAYHITAPAEDGDGAYPLHAGGAEARRHRRRPTSTTSTPTAPRRRSATRSSSSAVERLFGNAAGKLSMSSTKSATGHLLGAAGAVEAIFSILAMRDSVAPPTLNLDNPSVETRDRPRAAPGAKRESRRRAVELVRLRRHQRLAGLPARGVSSAARTAPRLFAIIAR